MKMKIKLISDFLDYYDHHFDLDGQIYKRLTKSGMNRLEMLNYLNKMGFKTPVYGICKDLCIEDFYNFSENKDNPKINVVVYLDINSHQGMNKKLMTYKEALFKHPNNLIVEYHKKNNIKKGQSESLRLLKIAHRVFWLRYSSFNSWKSNCGNVSIDILPDTFFANFPMIKEPLYAIDFIKNENEYYAIDFNIAPMLKGTGIEKIIPPKTIANAIKCFIKKNPNYLSKKNISA